LSIAHVFTAAYRSGPLTIICATALMALQDTIVKFFNEGLPIWQLFFLRSALILPILILAGRHNRALIAQAFKFWVLLRSILVVAMYVFFYAALPLLDLSVVAGVYYTAPLWIFMFSVIFLGERVSWLQTMIMVGAFCGVLIVLQPGSAAFSPASIVPLLAAICYALVAIITRAKITTTAPLSLIISLNAAFMLVGWLAILTLAILHPDPTYPFLLTPWLPLTPESTEATALLAVISVGIHLLLAKAYQLGPTTTVAGLDYSYLVFAALWGVLFLGSVPSVSVIFGTCIICAAGLALLWISPRQR